MIKRFKFRPFQKRKDALELDLVVEVDGRSHRWRAKVPSDRITPAALRAVANGRTPSGRSPAAQWGREFAEQKLARLTGKGPARVKRPPLFSSFAKQVLTVHLDQIQAKPATRTHYQAVLNAHLLPRFGRLRLDEIGPAQIAELQTIPGLRASTINRIGATLRAMLNWAIELELIEKAPKIKRLKEARDKLPEDMWWNERQLGQLVQAAREIGTDALVLVLLGADAGLRVGEMCALRWQDIDFAARKLNVRRNLSGGVVVSTPKGSRQREVPLSSRLVKALRAHRHLAHESVFYRLKDEQPARWSVETARHLLGRVCDNAKLERGGPHKLRHTCGSRLGARCFPLHEIARFLGHAKTTTTEIYLHSRRETQRAMADALG